MVGSDESSLRGLQIAAFFLCPHKAEREKERGRREERPGISSS